MKTCFTLEKFLCASLLLATIVGLSDADTKRNQVSYQNKRRGGNTGLYAFPRVGRSDPSLAAANNFHDAADQLALETLYPAVSLEDYEEYPKSDLKRASLIAFPRVGRSNDVDMRKWARLLALQQALEKRTGPSATSGLWFGPRLGKRSVDANDFEEATAVATKEQKENF